MFWGSYTYILYNLYNNTIPSTLVVGAMHENRCVSSKLLAIFDGTPWPLDPKKLGTSVDVSTKGIGCA